MSNYHLPSKLYKEIVYVTRYAGSGLINTVFGFIVIFLVMALGFSPVISNIAGYAVGFIFGFILSKKFVFRSNDHFVSESVRYLFAFIVSFLINILALRLGLIYFNLHVAAAQLFAAIAYTITMYTFTRLFVFFLERGKPD